MVKRSGDGHLATSGGDLTIMRLLIAVAMIGPVLLFGCAKKPAMVPAAPAAPIVVSNHDEPVIFNGQKFIVSFKYGVADKVYDVEVRRASRPLSAKKESDLKDAAQVASSTLTHYACPGSTKARPTLAEPLLSKKGAWTTQLRCS